MEVPEDPEDTCLGPRSSFLVRACAVFELVYGEKALGRNGPVPDEVMGDVDLEVFRLSDHNRLIGGVAAQV